MTKPETVDPLETLWSALQPFLEDKTPLAFNDALRFLVKALSMREWPNKRLDPMIALGEAAIVDALSLGETDRANMHCYNVSANLADCWGDGFVRERRHFEKGLELAERALNYRRQLKKGPGPFAMAHWVKGKHLLSLGKFSEAEKSFHECLNYEKQAAEAQNKSSELSPEAPFGLILAFGFLGLAGAKLGKEGTRGIFEKSLSILGQIPGENGTFGILQLKESERLNC